VAKIKKTFKSMIKNVSLNLLRFVPKTECCISAVQLELKKAKILFNFNSTVES